MKQNRPSKVERQTLALEGIHTELRKMNELKLIEMKMDGIIPLCYEVE